MAEVILPFTKLKDYLVSLSAHSPKTVLIRLAIDCELVFQMYKNAVKNDCKPVGSAFEYLTGHKR